MPLKTNLEPFILHLGGKKRRLVFLPGVVILGLLISWMMGFFVSYPIDSLFGSTIHFGYPIIWRLAGITNSGSLFEKICWSIFVLNALFWILTVLGVVLAWLTLGRWRPESWERRCIVAVLGVLAILGLLISWLTGFLMYYTVDHIVSFNIETVSRFGFPLTWRYYSQTLGETIIRHNFIFNSFIWILIFSGLGFIGIVVGKTLKQHIQGIESTSDN